jgi:hypothetical protein
MHASDKPGLSQAGNHVQLANADLGPAECVQALTDTQMSDPAK